MQNSTRLTPRILARSSDWLVVFKPAGMLTIPPSRHPCLDRTFSPAGCSAPASHSSGEVAVPDLQSWAREHEAPVWITHRLDRETSGVVLLGRTEEAHRQACLWFQQRKIKKQYACLAIGVPSAPIFKVNEPIRGAPSVTQIEVQERFAGVFLARVFPRTGRRHQIRIHLAKSGHSLLGDRQYGGPEEVKVGPQLEDTLRIERVALHASVLELPTGEKFEAPFPEDFSSWLSQLRRHHD